MSLRPQELYVEGRLTEYVEATERSSILSERIMRVRALMRLKRHREALDEIVELKPVTDAEDAWLRAVESICHSLSGSTDMARRVLGKIRPRELPIAVQFEIAYARFLIGWAQGSVELMSAALDSVDVRSEPSLYALWMFARSWLLSAQERYAEQLELLQETCTFVLEQPEARDIFLLANATQSIAHLVREIAAPTAFAFVKQLAESLPWNDDLQTERFLTFRGLAWASALRGLHQQALEYAYAARDLASTQRWVMACYADQAYLARMGGQQFTAGAMLQHAVKNAFTMSWESTTEERIALLNLVELTVDHDVKSAQRLLDLYDSISVPMAPRLALAHDRRLRAMENYVRACVFIESGRRPEAITLLRESLEIFGAIQYRWRAATTAMMLHSVTNKRIWLDQAAQAVEGLSDSCVARDIQQRIAYLSDERVNALTRAQRKVFDLLCEGLTDKAIAESLGISPETVRNHAARVRSTFGVRSRGVLIASMRQKAS